MKWNSSVVLGAVLVAQHGIQVVEGQAWFVSRLLRGGGDDNGSVSDKGTGKKVQRALDAMGNADVLYNQVCMQQAAGFNLGCTAGDVRLASATNINISKDGNGGCAFAGDMVTFTADFEVVLTAQARYDIGIWFSEDGDPNGDDSKTGICTAVTPAYGPGPNCSPTCIDLDGTNNNFPGTNQVSGIQDTCGDIESGVNNPLFQTIELTVTCIDINGDGFLDLPYCTSWRQPGDNDLCTSPFEAVPGSPSKCKCEDLSVDIVVPPCVPEDCADDCNDGDCSTGVCVPKPKAASTPCQDGNYCTSFGGVPGDADHCDGYGKCVGDPVNCGPGDQCNDSKCDEGADACVTVPKAASTPCQDGLYCTSFGGKPGDADHCDGYGKCVGDAVNCGPGDQCNDKKCDEGADTCVTVPKAASTPCQDGLYCTSFGGKPGDADHCDGYGKCVGDPVNCGPGDQCNDKKCDEGADACVTVPKAASTPCQDGLYCTSFGGKPGDADHCDGAGKCVGDAVTCNDNNVCTTDSCNEGTDQCFNVQRTGYYLKCGTDLYLCGILQSEITKVGNSYNVGGCNTGRVTKVFDLSATCLTDPIPLPPKKCPDGKDLSNYGFPICKNGGWTGCVSQFP